MLHAPFPPHVMLAGSGISPRIISQGNFRARCFRWTTIHARVRPTRLQVEGWFSRVAWGHADDPAVITNLWTAGTSGDNAKNLHVPWEPEGD